MGAAASYVKNAKDTQVTYIPPVDPILMGFSKEDLILHSRKGETNAIGAGLELLRRADNKFRKGSVAGK